MFEYPACKDGLKENVKRPAAQRSVFHQDADSVRAGEHPCKSPKLSNISANQGFAPPSPTSAPTVESSLMDVSDDHPTLRAVRDIAQQLDLVHCLLRTHAVSPASVELQSQFAYAT
eukprot:m.11605 g.11605  ORF g.11605 m.11605 type:complete len:116 (+) comp9856_c0_seq1:151-498(+)